MGCGWTLRGLAAAFRVLYKRKFNNKKKLTNPGVTNALLRREVTLLPYAGECLLQLVS